MKALVKFIGSPYVTFGISDTWLFFDKNEVTVRELVTKLEKERGIELNLEISNIVVLVNGRDIEFMAGLDTELKDLDEVVVAFIIAGG